MANYRQNASYGEIQNEDFKYDPEAEDNTKKYRLPFALCKSRGIKIEDWWTPKDAWAALERRGINPSDEYNEYFEKLKEKRRGEKKESNKRAQKRRLIKNKQLTNPAHNPTKGYEHKTGFIDGAQKKDSMSFKQADEGKVNPFFASNQMGRTIGYATNCQTCVATYYARRIGYDVRALPNLNNKSIAMLSFDTTLAYKTEEGVHPQKVGLPHKKKIEWLSSIVSLGDIYALEFSWGHNKGHIVCVERDKNGVFIYDPQINKIYMNSELQDYIRRGSQHKIFKLSGCSLDEKFCDKIMKGKIEND